MNIMFLFNFLSTFLLYAFSIGFSFVFTGLIVKPKYATNQQIENEDDEEKKMLEHLEEINFEFKYLDEYEALPDKNETNETNELNDLNDINCTNLLKDKITTLDIPFLKVKIIMYYDDAFYYYCNTDVVYKYLNVACRKFVIENNVKHLYIEKTESEEVKTKGVSSDLFISKSDSVLLEKKMNKFIRVGSIHDYETKHKNKKNIKEINISDFLKQC
jgi:hypothetical protein